MKIKEIRTRVIQWKGKTVPLPPHFCTNAMDLLQLPQGSMQTYTFHEWLVTEIIADNGLVGIGNAALSPVVTKKLIDTYLKPLLIGADPWDLEFIWQHMYRKTMAFGRKGVGMVAISAVDIGLWDLLGKSAKQPCYRLMGGRTKARIPVYASRMYATPLDELARARGQSLAQMAVVWVLRKPAVTSAMIGASRPQQIADCAAALQNLTFAPEELAAIDRIVA